MKKALVVANWKCNPSTEREVGKILNEVKRQIRKITNVQVVICPPFLFLPFLREKIKNTKIVLGAQDVFYQGGSFTGEISPKMLKKFGVKYVITGHSERRKLGEDDQIINKKIKSLLELKMNPILCVGETKEMREKEKQFEVVERQILAALRNVKKTLLDNLIIAYEPVWAISTNKGKLCSSDDIMTMKLFIKQLFEKNFGAKISEKIKILYGGSVNDKNIQLVRSAGIDGVLVGGASLNPQKFILILKAFS
ncbi:triose-phosphate isomerase [bacterium]|nr:triose-phosphate isomerase [bacterium]